MADDGKSTWFLPLFLAGPQCLSLLRPTGVLSASLSCALIFFPSDVPGALHVDLLLLACLTSLLIESVRARKQPDRLTDAPAPKTKKAKTTKSPKPAKAAKGKKAAGGAKGAKKGTKKAKKEKDPNAPKRPLTAFMFFSKDVRATVKAENPNMTFGELGTAIAAKWAKATPAEKKKYEAQAAKDKTRYAPAQLRSLYFCCP